jgi:hypothetical protein
MTYRPIAKLTLDSPAIVLVVVPRNMRHLPAPYLLIECYGEQQ